MTPLKRTFYPPTSTLPGCSFERLVDRWEWTRAGGVRVFYRDGSSRDSVYTLPALLAEEKPREPDWYLNAETVQELSNIDLRVRMQRAWDCCEGDDLRMLRTEWKRRNPSAFL